MLSRRESSPKQSNRKKLSSKIEPSRKESKEYVNGAIAALKEERPGITKREIIKQLEKDSGLNRSYIYELMNDDFKREWRKLTTDFGGKDETESPPSGLSKPKTHKVVMSDLQLEQLLISELEKVSVKPEKQVTFDRMYKYPRPYYANIKVRTSLGDALKSRIRAKKQC